MERVRKPSRFARWARRMDTFCCFLLAVVLCIHVARRVSVWRHNKLLRSRSNRCIVADPLVVDSSLQPLPTVARPCPAAASKGTRRFLCTSKSRIAGVGVFAGSDISCGIPLGVGIVNGTSGTTAVLTSPLTAKVTPLGKLVNHCSMPNVKLVKEMGSGRWVFVGIAPLHAGQEVTLDYNDLPWFIQPPLPWWSC